MSLQAGRRLSALLRDREPVRISAGPDHSNPKLYTESAGHTPMSHYPEARFLKSADAPPQFVPDTGAEVAFAGRSNAGKSSAINAIVNRRQFARTSKTPGRTQLVNFFHLHDETRLVDLPGYGFAKVADRVRQHWGTLMSDYFQSRRSLRGLFLVCDMRRGITDFDRQMLAFAHSVGLPTHVLLTKADKLKRGQAARAEREARKELAGAATLQAFSAITRLGVDDARSQLEAFLSPPGAG